MGRIPMTVVIAPALLLFQDRKLLTEREVFSGQRGLASKRPRPSNRDRIFWAWPYRFWSTWRSVLLTGGWVDCVRFLEQLRVGDRLRTEAIVIGKRRSKTSGQGYLTLALTTRRADGTALLTQQWKLIVPAGAERNMCVGR